MREASVVPKLDDWLRNVAAPETQPARMIDLIDSLAGASAVDKALLYRQLGLRLVYEPTTRTVQVLLSGEPTAEGSSHCRAQATTLHLR